MKIENFAKKIILSAFIFGLTFNANAAKNIGETANLSDQKKQQLEERFNQQKENAAQEDQAAQFETNARSNEAPPINRFEGWNKLSNQEKSAVKKHHNELRGKEKAPTFEKKAAAKSN